MGRWADGQSAVGSRQSAVGSRQISTLADCHSERSEESRTVGKSVVGSRKMDPEVKGFFWFLVFLAVLFSAFLSASSQIQGQEKPAAPDKAPVISEATLHRFWHAAYSLDQANTQLKKAQDEFAAVREEIDKACGEFVVNINPRTSEPTCGGPRNGPSPVLAPAPKKEPDAKKK